MASAAPRRDAQSISHEEVAPWSREPPLQALPWRSRLPYLCRCPPRRRRRRRPASRSRRRQPALACAVSSRHVRLSAERKGAPGRGGRPGALALDARRAPSSRPSLASQAIVADACQLDRMLVESRGRTSAARSIAPAQGANSTCQTCRSSNQTCTALSARHQGERRRSRSSAPIRRSSSRAG
jgi:hypothetical protein